MIAWLKARWAWFLFALGSALGGIALLFRAQRDNARKDAERSKREAADAQARAEIAQAAADRARAEAEAAANAQAAHDIRRAEIAAQLEAKKAASAAERDKIVGDALKRTGTAADEFNRRRKDREEGR